MSTIEDFKAQVAQLRIALDVADEEDRPELLSVIEGLDNIIQTLSAGNDDGGSYSQNSDIDAELARFGEELKAMEAELTEDDNDYNEDDSESAPGFNGTIRTDDDASFNDADNEDEDSDSSTDDNEVNANRYTNVQEGTDNDTKNENCIKEYLKELEGMKCLAPHEEGWGQIGFYPAMISQVVDNSEYVTGDGSNDTSEESSLNSILLRVVFIQPVVKSQLLCPFFQEDKCRFDDDACRFSHGEIVPLSKLREFREPDYSMVVPSARVLAKFQDDLWYKATVTRLTSNGNCEVQFDRDNEKCEVGIHEVNPILPEDCSDSSDSSDNSDIENETNSNSVETAISDAPATSSNSLLLMKGNEALGDWEKYTKGFGSKLMIKMGYVMGSGLGKQSEGRIDPVDAVIVPLGMGLDTWMEMKEKRKHGGDWFSVEKKLKRARKRHAKKEKALQEKKKDKPESIFDFINTKLFLSKPKHQHKKSQQHHHHHHPKGNIAKQSTPNLNKEMLSLGESIRKLDKSIVKIKQSMKRIEGRDAATLSAMQNKLDELEKSKADLLRKESKISREQKCRSDKKKLLEF